MKRFAQMSLAVLLGFALRPMRPTSLPKVN